MRNRRLLGDRERLLGFRARFGNRRPLQEGRPMEFQTISRSSCPLCGSKKRIADVFEVWDRLYGQPDSFPEAYCSACDPAFLREAVAPSAMPSLYEKYYPSRRENFQPSWEV